MEKKSFLECEAEKMRNLELFRLPRMWRTVGIWVTVLSFIGLFANAIFLDIPWVKALVKYGLLIGLLLVSLSREEVEDELIVKLRMQSYSFAFLAGVMYTLILPPLAWALDYLRQAGDTTIEDTGDWVVLFMLLSIQVFYFEALKRLHQ